MLVVAAGAVSEAVAPVAVVSAVSEAAAPVAAANAVLEAVAPVAAVNVVSEAVAPVVAVNAVSEVAAPAAGADRLTIPRMPRVKTSVVALERGDNFLLLEPAIPDWIVIARRFYPIVERMKGDESIDHIIAEAAREFPEDAQLLDMQIRDFCARSFLLDGNDPPRSASPEGRPKYIYLTLTDRCNLRCSYCYAQARTYSPELTLQQWISIVDRCNEAFGPVAFTFTGGEPLLVEYVFDLADHISRINQAPILLTNGILLSKPDYAKRAANVFSQIRISLDSQDAQVTDNLRGRGVTSKVKSALRNCERFGNTPIVQCTVCSENQLSISGIASTFGSNCNFQPLIKIGRAGKQENFALSGAQYFNILKEAGVFLNLPGYRQSIDQFRGVPYKRCALGIEELSFGPNGDMFPCHMMHYDEVKVGNALENDILQLYSESAVLHSVRKLNVDTVEQCRDCIVRNFCGTGCRARIGIAGVDITANDPFCEFEKYSVLDALFDSYR